MNTPQMQAEIERLALAYCKLTGLALSCRGVFDHRTRSWYEWIRAGFNVHQLETVVLFLKAKIREQGWPRSMLNFSYLIERPDRFEEWLAQAQAEKRNEKPAPSPRELVVQQWRPTVGQGTVPITAKPVSELIADLKRSAGMEV